MTGQQVQALHIVDEVTRRRVGSRLIGEQAPQRPWALHWYRYHQFLGGSPSCFTSTRIVSIQACPSATLRAW